MHPGLPLVIVQGGDTVWVDVHQDSTTCPGDPFRGGEATGGPGPAETWCFEGGAHDTSSTGPLETGSRRYVFTHLDRRTRRDDYDSLYWHGTVFQSVGGSGDMCMWCGGENNRCLSWQVTSGGYGNFWNQIMMLELGPFSITRGCSLSFRTRYVIECDYDFAYLEYYSFRDGEWKLVDSFTGKSGCYGPLPPCATDWNDFPSHNECLDLPDPLPWGAPAAYPRDWRGEGEAPRDHPEYPYGGGAGGQDYVVIPGDSISSTPDSAAIRLRWRFTTDDWISAEAPGNEEVRGFWVDDVVVKWDKIGPGDNTFLDTFFSVPEGGLPQSPWSFPTPESVYDGWAVRHDLDPPYEGYFLPNPGDSGLPSTCEINAGWQWSIRATGMPIPPPTPPLSGPRAFLISPAVPLDYSDGQGGPLCRPGVVIQYDRYANMDSRTCDYYDTKVQVHRGSVPGWDPVSGAWCPWSNIDGHLLRGSGSSWDINVEEDATAFVTPGGFDSVRFCWAFVDMGELGDPCWDPTLPPHVANQCVVDNISVGLYDRSATVFTAWPLDFYFQDTFNVYSCLHTGHVANIDLRYWRYFLQRGPESLSVTVKDPDGIAPGNVELRYSCDGGESWDPPVLLNLSLSDPLDPGIGGVFRGTICDTPWVPGTEILYYIYAVDDLGNDAYFPVTADPEDEGYPEYFSVEILPSPGAKILLVDDFGRQQHDYHPCRRETTTQPVVSFYRDILEDLGYGYMSPGGFDVYDVRSPETARGIIEPWGFWRADPDSPDVGQEIYDIVIWTTGPYLDERTICDTTQIHLKQYVFHGGNILITGDRIGQDLTDPRTPVDHEFYPYILASELVGTHTSPLLNPARFPKVPDDSVHTWLAAGDSCHLYSGCEPMRQLMDKITMTDPLCVPSWCHPGPFMLYEDVSAPYDSLAGIYNLVTFGPDTGKVVYLPFSIDAIVDSTTVACWSPTGVPEAGVPAPAAPGLFRGRADLLIEALRFFGENPETPRTMLRTERIAEFATALRGLRPNPFNRRTTVRFELAERVAVRVAVYDVLGRQVRVLVDGVRRPGPHTARWDGRDARGRRVASGIYFARMETDGFADTRKMVLLD